LQLTCTHLPASRGWTATIEVGEHAMTGELPVQPTVSDPTGSASPPPSGPDHASKLVLIVTAMVGQITTIYVTSRSIVITVVAAAVSGLLVLAYLLLHR
jgi:hypothetical protein